MTEPSFQESENKGTHTGEVTLKLSIEKVSDTA